MLQGRGAQMGTDNLHHKRKIGRAKAHEQVREKRQKEWLLVCEGKKTECNYFKGLVNNLNATGNSKILLKPCGEGKNTTSLIDSVDKHFDYLDKEYGLTLIPYTKIIFVFDKDDFAADKFNSAVIKASIRFKDCIVAWSNESFELWLNLHFNYITSGLKRWEYNDKLTHIFRSKNIFTKTQNYEDDGKTLPNIFDKIASAGGCYKTAVHYAKMLEAQNKSTSNPARSNPVTMVHKAVEALCMESSGRTN